MKRVLLLTLVISILFTTSVFGQGVIDTKNIETGVLGVYHVNNNGKAVKVLVEKGQERYQYNLNSREERIPLQLGNGSYQITFIENTEGNNYRVFSKDTVNLNLMDENSVFLGSIQMMKWDPAMTSIKKAQELVKGLDNDEEKVKAIYTYIINNIEYDYAKLNSVTSTYLPEIDNTFRENKGICYDYASLFASMLRSVEIPTKLIMGYAPDVKEYHAWNEVYIADKGQWVTVDTTVDAQYKRINKDISMIKNSKLFNGVKAY